MTQPNLLVLRSVDQFRVDRLIKDSEIFEKNLLQSIEDEPNGGGSRDVERADVHTLLNDVLIDV